VNDIDREIQDKKEEISKAGFFEKVKPVINPTSPPNKPWLLLT
jgi:hypothetical protein